MDYICDIVVLTWNQKNTTKDFIESFQKNTILPARLIIIDNASKDDTASYLKSLKDTELVKFKVIINDQNKGFVGGMNQGIEASSAPYVCLANNDLIFTSGWLKEVIRVFENDTAIGVLNPNSNNLGPKPKPGESIEGCARRLKQESFTDFLELPFCIGFCMFIKREVINKVGGLSKEFQPMFFEDSDYSMKAKKAGYKVGVAHKSYVWHIEHASFVQWPQEKERIFVQSRQTFTKKWGKILRIGWIVKNEKDIIDNLERAVNLSREGNYLFFYGVNIENNRREIFKKAGLTLHSGVNCVSFRSIIGIIIKVIVKKKKFNLLIVPPNLVSLLRVFKFAHRAEIVSAQNQEILENTYKEVKFDQS
jgi:GT2 family glycosyltransferase